MISDVRVKVPNGYGVMQTYSVDLWQGFTMPSPVYLVCNEGGPRSDKKIRRGTKVYARAINAAKVKVRCAAVGGEGEP